MTRHEIERIRGVDVGAVLQTLLERDLIMIKGRDAGPGRALLYGTTQEFLEYFGLSRLADLPQLDEIAALAREKGTAGWTEEERDRLAKHGVEPESVPGPWQDEAQDAPAAGESAAQAPAGEEGERLPEETPPPCP
jgi:segregation and condensation protein B